MKAVRSSAALGVLILLAGFEAAAQPADSPHPPPVPPAQGAPSPNGLLPAAPVSPPGIHRLEIKPDTPAERAAFLARRRATMERQKIETVAPLPAQRITPSPGPEPTPQKR